MKKIITIILSLLLIIISSCNNQSEKQNLNNNLDLYYNKFGNEIIEVIDWINKTENTSNSFVYEYRVKPMKIFCYYLDSTLKREDYFNPSQTFPENYLNTLDESSISDIIKINSRNYYEIKFAKFSSAGYDISILIFPKANEKEIKRTLDSVSSISPVKWIYNKGNGFVFLIKR